MSYSLGMPLAKSDCGCSSTSSGNGALAVEIPGLKGQDALNSDILLQQGTTQEMVICYTSGEITPEIACIKRTGHVLFGSDAVLCFKNGDLVRLINFDACKQDSGEIYMVDGAPVLVNNQWEVKLGPTPANAAAVPPVPAGPTFTAAVANLQYDANGVYCFTSVAKTAPIGCVQTVKKTSSSSPRLMLHVPGGTLALSGAVTYRDDYYDEFGISADGTEWLTATSEVIGRVKVGDFITSPEASIPTPIRIQQVRRVEVRKPDGSGNQFIERWLVERKVAPIDCALVYVRRGTALNFEFVPDGDCTRVIIPGSMTSSLQLPADWKNSDGTYTLGDYTITATWATLRNGKLAPRTEVIKAGQVHLRPTHHFTTSR